MLEVVKRNNVYLIFLYGILEKGFIYVYNLVVIFDRKGKIMGEYCKNYLWLLEVVYFKGGEKVEVYDVDFGRFGVMICYDVGFLEVFRELILKGFEIIFILFVWRI